VKIKGPGPLNRLCIFAHYDRDNLVDDYILYYLEGLKRVSSYMIFVSTSRISESEISRVETICDRVMLRDNVGYDFMSWQMGIKAIVSLADFDELVLCNDSVYGPIYPLSSIFDAMTQKDCDFWGMTDSYQIAYHLQSYFLVFKKNLALSRAFRDFWDSVSLQKSKDDVIRKYEVGMTQTFVSAGFRPCAFAPSPSSLLQVLEIKAILALRSPFKAVRRVVKTLRGGYQEQISLNPTFFLWKDLIVKRKMPFLKIGLLRDSGDRVNTRGYGDIIKKHSSYDTELIRKHLERVKGKS
jgi:lipopolysaccharide biosynthesis protein